MSSIGPRGKADAMGESNDRPSREERLAAKLRENLRRRKSQARAMDDKPPLPKRGADG